MNNIYVDEQPESCLDCEFCIKRNYCCILMQKDVREYRDDCPLISLTDRLAEEFEALKETFVWGRDNGYLTPKSAVGIVENKIKDLRGK